MTSAPHKGLPRWGKGLIYGFIVVAVGALIWSQLPRGAYPTDLTRVGNGLPALVLAYEIDSSGGMEVMALLDEIRSEYADRVEFLVASLSLPDGHAFAQRHGAVNGTVMLFSGTGSHLQTMHQPGSTDELRQALDSAVAAQPE
ncbi:MAG: hypothetical protein R6W97_07190 [Thiobacillus sp.]